MASRRRGTTPASKAVKTSDTNGTTPVAKKRVSTDSVSIGDCEARAKRPNGHIINGYENGKQESSDERTRSFEDHDGHNGEEVEVKRSFRPVAIEIPVSAGKAVGRRTHRTPTKPTVQSDADAIQTLAVLASGGDKKIESNGKKPKKSTPRKQSDKSSKTGSNAKARTVTRKDGNKGLHDDEVANEKTLTQRKRKRKLFARESDDFFSLKVLCDASFMALEAESKALLRPNGESQEEQEKVDIISTQKESAKSKTKKKVSKENGKTQSAKKKVPEKRAKKEKDVKNLSENRHKLPTILDIQTLLGSGGSQMWPGGREIIVGTRRRKSLKYSTFTVGKNTGILDRIEKDRKAMFRQFPFYSQHLKLIHCLSPAVRRWCSYEWFYSAIDQPWYQNNDEITQFLEYAGIAGRERKNVKLNRTEWSIIRGAMGKPRRLSKAFLQQERKSLEKHRQEARMHYYGLSKKLDGNVTSSLPSNIPLPLTVGQRVYAKHPKMNHQVADGSILTAVQNQRFRVQFDQADLGAEMVEDIDCMPMPNNAELHTLDADTTATLPISQGVIQRLSSYDVLSMNGTGPSSLGQELMQHDMSLENFKASVIIAQAKEETLLLQNRLSQALDKKEFLVRHLERMNNEAESGYHAKVNGVFPEKFRIEYATLVAELPNVNHEIQEAVINLECRNLQTGILMKPMLNTYGAPNVNHQTQNHKSAPLLRQSPKEILHTSKEQAKEMVEDYFSRNSRWLRDKSNLNVRADYGEMWSENSRNQKTDMLVTPMVKELIVSCLAAFVAIQIYAEHTSNQEDINELMDHIHEMLKPRAVANSGLFNVIGGMLNDISVLLQPRPLQSNSIIAN